MVPTTENRLSLPDCQAADLMSAGLESISSVASFDEALAFFIERNVSVAPVTRDSDEPVGVLSVTDLLIHMRACNSSQANKATVESLMTPTIFSVPSTMPASAVVRDMLRSNVHHLFVADDNGTISGVISTCDVLRRLQE